MTNAAFTWNQADRNDVDGGHPLDRTGKTNSLPGRYGAVMIQIQITANRIKYIK